MSRPAREIFDVALASHKETQELKGLREELIGFMTEQYEREYLLEDPGTSMTEGFITNLARFVLDTR